MKFSLIITGKHIDPNEPVRVNERVEAESVAPARAEVLYIDVRVAGRLALAPQKQRVLRAFAFASRLLVAVRLWEEANK